MNNADNEIVLPDGRRLAYAEFGKPEGFPVMYFHGSPSSRLEPLLIGDSVWSRLGLRIIAPDRPGIGRSDFQPNRGLVHWPQDMIALSDALGLAKFAALGNSGGAPYVAACAAMTPEQLTSAVIVSGGWRMDWPEAQEKLPFANRLLMALASKSQFLAQILLKSMAAFAGGAREKELAQLKKRVPSADYATFETPGRIEALSQMIRECMRQGAQGAAWDLHLYMKEFDLPLDKTSVPLKWFHGEKDTNVPIAVIRRLASEQPNIQLTTYQDEAHLSTLCNHIDEISHALVKN